MAKSAPTEPEVEGDLGSWLARVALAAAAVELVLLRLVSRTVIHIPGMEQVAGPYRSVALAGRYAYHAAAVLATIALAFLTRRLAAQGRTSAEVAVGAALVAFLAARLGLLDTTAFGLVAAVSVVILVVGITGVDPRVGISVGLFAAAFVVAAVHAIVQDLTGNGDLAPTSTIGLLLAAEVLLFGAALALLWATPRVRSTEVVAGVVVALFVGGVLVASPATSKVLMLWTVGMPGYFSAPVYALVAGVLTATLLAARRARPDLAVGLGLLVVGGIGLQNSYQTLLVVCGLAVLAAWAGHAEADAPPAVEHL